MSNHKTITNKFNDYFTNVAKKLLENMDETNNKFQDYFKNPNEHNLFMKETDPEEVNKYLNNLDMKKANDNYGISPKLIKIGASKLKLHVAFIFNQCLTHGIFPYKLKTAIVYPIHKRNSKHQCSNYRPISILLILSRVFEKTNVLQGY